MTEGTCRNDGRAEAIRSAEACGKPNPGLVCGESEVLKPYSASAARGEAPAAAGGPWSRFAFRAACVYTGNRARCESLHKELDRVGLDVQDFWAFPNPYDQVLMAAVPNACRAMRTVRSFFNSTMNHYRIVKTARALGYESILIVEDDARFLKDLRRVEEIVSALPSDYDVALFDWDHPSKASPAEYEAQRRSPAVNGFWQRFRDLRSLACWALSARGADAWLSWMEAPASDPGRRLRIGDQVLTADRALAGLNAYCAFPAACIQNCGSHNNSDHEGMLEKYRRQGFVLEDYTEE